MKKFILVMCCIFTSTAAFAWGDREQGALAGFAAGFILNEHLNHHDRSRHHPGHIEKRIYHYYDNRRSFNYYDPYPPRTRYTRPCHYYPVYGGPYDEVIGYTEICR